MRDSNEDGHENAHSGVDDKLALELLTEEERRYFAGKRQNSTVKKSLFNKRKTAKISADNYLPKAIIRNIADSEKQQQQLPTTLTIVKTSPWLNKQGRGLQVLVASIVLILLGLVAIFFTLKVTGYLFTKEDSLSTDKELPIEQYSTQKQTTVDEELRDNNDELMTLEDNSTNSSTTDSNRSNVTVERANAQSQSASAAKAKANKDSASNNNTQLVLTQTSEFKDAVGNKPFKEQNDNPSGVSYEDFEKESQRTLYRDDDYQ